MVDAAANTASETAPAPPLNRLTRLAFLSQEHFDAYQETGWLPRDGAFIMWESVDLNQGLWSLCARLLEIMDKEEWYRAAVRKVPKRAFNIQALHKVYAEGVHSGRALDSLFVIVKWSPATLPDPAAQL